ncbi:MAG: hypothetical protein DMF89_25840 [Acidobacteria bacterium]|nr:MAG: hypothetical protein DMF89_25840 [Acidobacteriota bacterium]
MRRLLPAIVLLPIGLGWVRLRGEEAGFYDTPFGTSLLVLSTIACLTALALTTSVALRRVELDRRRAVDEIAVSAQDQKFLLDLTQEIPSFTDPEALLHHVSTRLGLYLAVSRCVFSEIDVDGDRVVIHHDFYQDLPSIAGTYPLSSVPEITLAEARAGRVVMVNSTSTDPRTAEQFTATYRPIGVAASLSVPFLRHGRLASTLAVLSHTPRDWSAREAGLVQAVAERAWLWVEQIRLMSALRQSEARKTAMLNSALDGVVSIDRQGIILEFNPAAEKMFGYRRDDVVGRPMAEFLIPPSLREAHHRGFAHYLESGEGAVIGQVVELAALRADGSEFPVELAISAVEGQSPPLFTGFIRDITERTRSSWRFRLAIEAAPNGMIMVDQRGQIVLVNEHVEKLFGYERADLIGRQIEVLVPERFRGRHAAFRSTFAADPSVRPMGAGRELFGLRKDGTEVRIEIGLSPIDTPGGKFVLSSVVDITERTRTEDERRLLVGELQLLTKDLEQRVEARTRELSEARETAVRSEARYRALFDDSPISIWDEDFSDVVSSLEDLRSSGIGDLRSHLIDHPETVATLAARIKVVAVNQTSLEMFEADDQDHLIQSLPHIFGPEALDFRREELCAIFDRRGAFSGETEIHTVKGGRKHISLRFTVLPGHEATWSRVVASIFDLTSHVEAERQIRLSLREKEVLLKEVHHRVKNNLQVISSLLSLQARHLVDVEARQMLAESQDRVQSIALVHEKLYQSKNLSRVDFDDYVKVLVANLVHSMTGDERGISCTVALEGISLPVDVAIPCGLIVNELVTNSLKHAFPDSTRGSIRVDLRRADKGRLELAVEDDGVGLPSDFDVHEASSLGLELVMTFAEQLEADVDVRREHGTSFRFRFNGGGD